MHRSTDLSYVDAGGARHRTAVADGGARRAGGGIFAPTLRHHDGLFWIATTDVDRIEAGQLVIHAQDPAGPWSEPVFCAGTVGIDPDLAWDDAGAAFLAGRALASRPGSGRRVDLRTGVLQEEPRHLWPGTGLAATEGPHLHRRGPWWYLLVAEGGTERGHVVQVARFVVAHRPVRAGPSGSRCSPTAAPPTPSRTPGTRTSVESPMATWVMTYLGVRPHGVTPGFHVNGRETFLTGVAWEDAWPRLRTLGLPPLRRSPPWTTTSVPLHCTTAGSVPAGGPPPSRERRPRRA